MYALQTTPNKDVLIYDQEELAGTLNQKLSLPSLYLTSSLPSYAKRLST